MGQDLHHNQTLSQAVGASVELGLHALTARPMLLVCTVLFKLLCCLSFQLHYRQLESSEGVCQYLSITVLLVKTIPWLVCIFNRSLIIYLPFEK